MILAPELPDESLRLDALRGLDILDTPPEERFDRIARLARRLFDVPIALVSLVDADRQWFKSCVGAELTESPRDVSFCGHAIANRSPLVVEDARLDERFADNPFVTGEMGVRFYAGCPLVVGDRYLVGTLCLIDTAPRTFDDDDRAALCDLARLVEQELDAQHVASTDDLTALANRRGFVAAADVHLRVARERHRPVALLFFDLDGFKQINDRLGHAEGDRALTVFSAALEDAVRRTDVVARLGGDEFAVLLTDAGRRDADAVVERLRSLLERRCGDAGLTYDIEHSVGIVEFDPEHHRSLDDLLADADRRMYRHKRAG